MTTETDNISQSTDDCLESNVGAVDTSATFIYLNALQYGGGLRFQNVEVPKNAIIYSATLKMKCLYSCNANGCNTTIYGVDEDDTSTWGAGNKPSTQTQTTASTSFNVNGSFTPDLSYASLERDVTAIVQEIVDRVGWSSGNSMSFVIEKDSFGKAQGISIVSYDHVSWPESELEIVFLGAQMNILDTWKSAKSMKINISDVWKDVNSMKINISDVWKTIF